MRSLLLLLLLIPAAARADDRDSEIAELLGELASDDPYTRKVAHAQITKLGKDAVPPLVKTLWNREAPHRLQAIRMLGDLAEFAEPALASLIAALTESDTAIRIAAAEALGKQGPRAHKAVPKLIDLGRASDWPHRFAASDALAAIGGAAVEPLLKITAKNEDDVRSWTPGTFRDLGAKIVPAALSALQSKDESMRAAAADALGAAGPGAHLAANLLVGALHDDRAVVRRSAAVALGRIGAGSTDAIPALIHLANDIDRRAVPEALTALGEIVRDAALQSRRPPPPPSATRNAITLGLGWLAKHQDDDGRWDCDGFDKHAPPDNANGGGGEKEFDVGVTGLACLAMLECGEPERWRDPLRRGLRFLMLQQASDGCIGGSRFRFFMYRHAIGTLALCVAARVLDDPVYAHAAQRGLDFLAAGRNPDAAWRYEPRKGDNDTSITGWCILAFVEGELAGLRVDPAVFAGALAWVQQMTDEKTGRAGYDRKGAGAARPDHLKGPFPAEKTRSVTAEAVFIRLAAGEDRTTPAVRAGVDRVLEVPPTWDVKGGFTDFYYWFQGTRAMFYVGGSSWSKWRKALGRAVLPNQFPKDYGQRAGSWEPVGTWCTAGGRVYSTAMMVLCLETVCGYVHPVEMRLPTAGNFRAAAMTLRLAAKHEEPKIHETARRALARFTR